VLEREHGIRTNVTMVFSPTQALLAMKSGASFVSIVLSRLENVAIESDRLIDDTMAFKRQYGFRRGDHRGSVKTQPTLLHCLRAGVEIATIPEDLFQPSLPAPTHGTGPDQFNRIGLRSKKRPDHSLAESHQR